MTGNNLRSEIKQTHKGCGQGNIPEHVKVDGQFHCLDHYEHIEPFIDAMQNAKPSHPMQLTGQIERTAFLGIAYNRKSHQKKSKTVKKEYKNYESLENWGNQVVPAPGNTTGKAVKKKYYLNPVLGIALAVVFLTAFAFFKFKGNEAGNYKDYEKHYFRSDIKKARTLDKLKKLNRIKDDSWECHKKNLEISYKGLKAAYSKPFLLEGSF